MAEATIRHPDHSSKTLKLIAHARIKTSVNTFDVLTPPNSGYIQLVSAIDVPCLIVTGDAGLVSPPVAAELQRPNLRTHVK